MPFILNNSSMIPLYEQLINQIKAQVLSGELVEGDALPSVRVMARDLRISALTVKKAYDKLEEDGIVVTVHGKGSFIASTSAELAMEARRQAAEAKLAEALDGVRALGMSDDEIRELVSIILEEPS